MVTGSFVNPEQPFERRIGGVETYTHAFANAIKDFSVPVSILQSSSMPFICQLDNGIKVEGLLLPDLLKRLISGHDALTVLLDHSFLKYQVPCFDIFVQHGVYWDGFIRRFKNSVLHCTHVMQQRYLRWRAFTILRGIVQRCRLIITVDTNFQNWYRGLWPWDAIDNKCVYVPNFAPLFPYETSFRKWTDTSAICIIFARRFAKARGTAIWSKAASVLLQRHAHVEFIMAGEGSEEKEMRKICPTSGRVHYGSYTRQNLFKEMLRSHISVVPSLFCEGTSLSLLESMACGCVCIATPIGGICNILRDGVNGLIVPPSAGALVNAVDHILNNISIAKALAEKGWLTVGETHAEEQWKTRICAAVKRLIT